MSKQYIVQDYYYHKAKKDGYVARSAFKLIEINERFNILRKNATYLDIGCAPGSWIQVVSSFINKNNHIYGIDILDLKIEINSQIHFYLCDIYDDIKLNEIIKSKNIDIILSDIAPNTTGIRDQDILNSLNICTKVYEIVDKHLMKNGNFVMKMFYSHQFNTLISDIKKKFVSTHIYKPKSTRQRSFETYLICKNKKS